MCVHVRLCVCMCTRVCVYNCITASHDVVTVKSSHIYTQELAQEIANHKPELDTTVHAGKVAEYAGPAEQADAQPNKPQSGYSIAIKRYEDATAACQERIRQLEETLSKISEVKNDIEQLIEVLNECQSKISSSGRFRVKPDDAKTQLTTAQVSALTVSLNTMVLYWCCRNLMKR